MDLSVGLGVALLPLLLLAVPGIILFVVLPAIVLLALAAPLAVIGAVIAGPPYLVARGCGDARCGRLAAHPRRRSTDEREAHRREHEDDRDDPEGGRSDVASASVPTVNGASSTANAVTATARELASAARPGASATATDTLIGNRLPDPSPSSDRPATACAGAVAGHRTANPTAVTASASASSRAGSSARQSAAERPPGHHAAEVAGHQPDRDVGRTPVASSTNVAPQAVTHHSAAVTQNSTAAAIQNTRGRRPRTTPGGRRRVDRQPPVAPPHEQRDHERGEERDPPARVQRRRQRQGARQHDVGDAGRDVGLGQRHRATFTVVVGECGLDRHEQEPAAETHDQHRADRHRGDAPRGEPDRPRTHHHGGRPEQRPPSERALQRRGDPARDHAPGRERGDVQPADRVAQAELVAEVHDDESRRRLQVGEPGEHPVRDPGQPVATELDARPLRRPTSADLQLVRIVRERLAAVLGDQQQILEADAADALDALHPRLDRDDVAGHQRLPAGQPQPRRLVDLEPDAVAQPEVEAV